tara:strand:- start:3105 stop:3350 length:246 start_codon:yes stop_codon:yes gene_type:complete
MSYSKSKSTKRFNFKINRNSTSHKAGANTVIIGTNPQDGFYSGTTTQMTMTVKEARAFQRFLNQHLVVDGIESKDDMIDSI